MKKMITALVLTVLLVCSLALPVSADMKVDARDSVVVVTSLLHTNGAGSQSYGWGTGFFINDQYLVTNHHVIEAFLEYDAGQDIVLTLEDGTQVRAYSEIRVYYESTRYKEAFLVAYDEAKDIAILKLDEPTTERTALKLLVPTEEMVGSSVYAVGFPGLAENWFARATESWGKKDATVTAGTISRLYTQAGTGWQNIQTDCDIKHGNSGGPLVNSDGHVVGVSTWGYSDTEELEVVNYAVNISEVVTLLNVYGINYELVNGGDDWIGTILIVAAVAGAVLIAVVVVVVIGKNKKKKAAQKAAEDDAKKRAQEEAIRAAAPKPTIRSYAQANYGMSAVVGAQPLMIGRNSVCALRFPSNTPGISGSHCTVQWDAAAQVFVVTDLNSTYGSYLMSGQKMQPNQPYRMRAGDQFYLGEQGNTISLTME